MTPRTVLAIGTALLLSACAHPAADTAFQHIDSGITSQNGGGQNSTGGLPSGDIKTTPVGPGSSSAAAQGAPASRSSSIVSNPPRVGGGATLPNQPEAR